MRTDRFGSLDTAHDGHLHIHQDDIEMPAIEQIHGFRTIVGNGDPMRLTFKQTLGQLLIDRIILDQKDTESTGLFRRHPAEIDL